MTPRVRKAVIPAAGLGTRFLPATKAQPKEMLPVIDKPAIQYVVEEAVRSGIRDVLVVTGRGKRSLEDHFDRVPELEAELERKGKHAELRQVRELAEMAAVHFVRQGVARGLGHAVAMGRHHVGDEPFAVMLGDDIMDEHSRVLLDMIEAHERHQCSVIALMEVDPEHASLYGCVTPGRRDANLVEVRSVVEKPAPGDAPSNLAVVGRYVFTPQILDALDRTTPGAGGEIQLTDAIGVLAGEQTVYGFVFDKGRYDTGNKLDHLRATVELALERDDLAPAFGAFLADVVRRKNLV